MVVSRVQLANASHKREADGRGQRTWVRQQYISRRLHSRGQVPSHPNICPLCINLWYKAIAPTEPTALIARKGIIFRLKALHSSSMFVVTLCANVVTELTPSSFFLHVRRDSSP